MGEHVVLNTIKALAVGEVPAVVTLLSVSMVACLRCGGTRRTFRRVDRPVKGYVCTLCLQASNSAVLKVGKKDSVLVGPLAERIAGLEAKA